MKVFSNRRKQIEKRLMLIERRLNQIECNHPIMARVLATNYSGYTTFYTEECGWCRKEMKTFMSEESKLTRERHITWLKLKELQRMENEICTEAEK